MTGKHTIETHLVDDAQIKALRTAAAEAGDLEQVELCDRALARDPEARLECERVILDGLAQHD
jgi:hypothetical protein